jgi:hypothetical protein
MGKYLQILLTRNYDMASIPNCTAGACPSTSIVADDNCTTGACPSTSIVADDNCSIMHIQYGSNGWLEKIDNNYKGYRFIRQSHIDKHTIMQIVEEMDDGWVPEQILLTDTVFNTIVSTNELITENNMGWWNRKIMVLPLVSCTPLLPLAKLPLPAIQLETQQDEPIHLVQKNQRQQTHAGPLKKQPALLPTPRSAGSVAQSQASFYNNKSNSKNEHQQKFAQPSSYNRQYTSLKAHHANQSSFIPLIPLIDISTKHHSTSQYNHIKRH